MAIKISPVKVKTCSILLITWSLFLRDVQKCLQVISFDDDSGANVKKESDTVKRCDNEDAWYRWYTGDDDDGCIDGCRIECDYRVDDTLDEGQRDDLDVPRYLKLGGLLALGPSWFEFHNFLEVLNYILKLIQHVELGLDSCFSEDPPRLKHVWVQLG